MGLSSIDVEKSQKKVGLRPLLNFEYEINSARVDEVIKILTWKESSRLTKDLKGEAKTEGGVPIKRFDRSDSAYRFLAQCVTEERFDE